MAAGLSLPRIMIAIGRFELYLFNDATAWVDPGGVFGLVPRALWSRYVSADARNLVPLSHHNLLIKASGANVLVDTGFGNCLLPAQQKRFNIERGDGTHAGLAALGIAPDDIDIVINTHLHDDHCSGNFRLDADGQRLPAFPKAEYLVQRREYQDASNVNERTRATYNSANYQPLFESGQLRLLDGDCQILPGLDLALTPGHTPGHMSLRIASEGQHAAFLCDLASYAVHFERLAWMTAYDLEPLLTMETKRLWQAWALENEALLIFPHDGAKPAGYLTQGEKGRFHVEPIRQPYAIT